MALLGTYVGIIPVALGMLVLPVLRRASRGVVRMLLALTVGLLGFLAVDAAFEGFALAERSGGAFGGPLLVLLGAAFAFLIQVRSIACSTATSEVNKQPPMGGDWR
jgi:zinc transporter, ZIP family